MGNLFKRGKEIRYLESHLKVKVSIKGQKSQKQITLGLYSPKNLTKHLPTKHLPTKHLPNSALPSIGQN